MADNGKNIPKWLQFLATTVLAILLPWAGWISVSLIKVDKDLSTFKAVNENEHVEFAADDDEYGREQRAMSLKLDKTHDAVIRIAAKMEISVP